MLYFIIWIIQNYSYKTHLSEYESFLKVDEKYKGGICYEQKNFIFISLILIIGLPLTIDWLIIENKLKSNINNFDWIGFLDGYIGALIGVEVSFVGIINTIRYTSEQNKKDRKLLVRPYCAIRYVHDNKLVGINKIIGELPIGCEPQENNGPEYINIVICI